MSKDPGDRTAPSVRPTSDFRLPTSDFSSGFWSEVWRRYKKSRLGLAALATVLILTLIATFAPCIAGTRPIVCRYKGSWYFPATFYWTGRENPVFFQDDFGLTGFAAGLREHEPEAFVVWPLFYADPYRRVEDGEWPGRPGDPYGAPPSARHPFGTDALGYDVLARMVHGTSIALLVGFLAMAIALAIGLVVGGLAGYCGGWVDFFCSRLIELVMSVPALILILALIAILERPTIWHTMAVIGCTRWDAIARYVRAEFLRLKALDFVAAARALGVPAHRIMIRHLLPNALAPVVVTVTFGIAGAILLESALSFLGIGTGPGSPSWGRILNEGFPSFISQSPQWWLILFPGLGIFLTVLVYNLVGDTIQEASDPRLRS